MRTSYSQVRNADECIRLWAFSSYGGRFEERGQEQDDGDDLHSHIEGNVKFGLAFDLTKPMARLAALAIDYFPAIVDEPCTENDDVLSYGGHEYVVKCDLMWLAPRGPIVMDHKTVKHFRFALTGSKLRMNLQACIYALYAMKKYGYESCTVIWIYYRRPDPEKPDEVLAPETHLQVAEAEITRDDAMKVLRAQQKLVDYMAHLKQDKVPPLQLKANRARCRKYGDKKPCFNLPICFPDEVQAHGSV